MRCGYLIWLAVLWPMMINAAPLRVLTGEHADFTRVVVAIPPETEWQLGRTDEGYALRMPVDDGYDLAGFFDLIPNDRIVDVSQDPGRDELRLRVDCRCHARASVYQGNYLVIDIRDGPAPRNSPFELALPAALTLRAREADSVQERRSYQPSESPLLPVITPRVADMRTMVGSGETQKDDVPKPAPQIQNMPTVPTHEARQLIAETLGESLGRALTDGLLEERRGPARTGPSGEPELAQDMVRQGPSIPGIDTKTGIDPFAINSTVAAPQTQVGQPCLDQSQFDIAMWGKDTPPHRQLQAARAALSASVDQPEADAFLALARLYVFLGFGREAVQTLDMENIQSRQRIILRAIAGIIDDEPVSQDLFIGQVSCPSHVALWALLAQPAPPTDAQVDRRAVITAYRALPTYVQKAIAPRLTEALLAIGAQDEAMQVMGQQPLTVREDVNVVLAEAALSEALGDEARAVAAVTEVVRRDPRTTPEAMQRFFENGIANEVAFADEDFLFADALRFENAGQPSAVFLADAQFKAYLSVDRFDDARRLLQTGLNRTAEPRLATLRSALFQQVADRLPDGAFLRFIWDEDFGTIDVETQHVIAARLIALGFPQRALAVLTPNGDGVVADEHTTLFREAEQKLAEQAAVRSANQQTGVVPSLGLETEDQSVSPSDRQTLGANRALVDEAEQTRQAIRALLESVPAPAEF